MAAVTICNDFGDKGSTVSIVSLSICHEVMRPDAMILVFWMLSFKPAFSLSPFTFHWEALQFLFFSAMRVSCVIITIDIFGSYGTSLMLLFYFFTSFDFSCFTSFYIFIWFVFIYHHTVSIYEDLSYLNYLPIFDSYNNFSLFLLL